MHVDGSGRTDAGVHALAQVAAFRLTNPIPLPNLKKAMNRLLPRDIRVMEAAEAHDSFHPRYDATAKTYEYRILRAEICPPFDRRYVYHYPYPLDEARMIEAARLLEGEHDFSAFAAADPVDATGRSKVRRIFSSCLMKEDRPEAMPDLPRPWQRIPEAHGPQHRGRAAGGGEGKPRSGRYRGSAKAGLQDSGGTVGAGAGIVFGECGIRSVVTQGGHRVDLNGAPGGDVTGRGRTIFGDLTREGAPSAARIPARAAARPRAGCRDW